MIIRTLVVDSNFLLKRSYSAWKSSYTKPFGHIGGLYGFFSTLRKEIKKHAINKVVSAWDGQNGGLMRYRIDKSYKANRHNKKWHEKIEFTESELIKEKANRESILRQRKRIQQYSEELFLRQIEVDEIEADDLISAYVQRHADNEDIFLYTNDRDLSQLLEYGIKIIFSNINEVVTSENFFFHFGYHYQNVATLKIICGDQSDNISGIKGIREKTIIKYFPDVQVRYVSVREICKNAIEINKQRLKEKKQPLKVLNEIINNIDVLKINYKLISLKEPLLNNEAINELDQLEMPLSPTGRGSKNLYKMMKKDDFLSEFGGSFSLYVEPFYSVIMGEKETYNNFFK